MADTHMIGRISEHDQNQGAIPSLRRKVFNLADFASPVTLCRVTGTTQSPILLELFINTKVVFNAGTTNVLQVGIPGDPDKFDDGTNVELEATGFSNLIASFDETNDIVLTYAQTGTAASTGQVEVWYRVAGGGHGVGITY